MNVTKIFSPDARFFTLKAPNSTSAKGKGVLGGEKEEGKRGR